MVVPRQKRGEGMGRAAAADVLGGWGGMVPASPDHAPVPAAAAAPPAAAPPTAANALAAFAALI